MRWRLGIVLVATLARLMLGVDDIGASNDRAGVVEGWRESLVASVSRRLPEPEGALVLGIILGYKSSLPAEFYQALVNSGTIHMVVASGYNIMVVTGLALSFFLVVVTRKWASLGACLVMIAYVLLTGGQPSIVRAAVMGTMLIFGSVWGRTGMAGWSLVLAAWLMIMVDPMIVGSISFQLSLAATFGVLILAPHLKRRLGESGAVLAIVVEKLDLTTSLGALLVTWPIIWFHFGRLSLISLASNGVILPLVPPLMAFGALMMVAEVLPGPFGLIFSWPTYALAHLVVVLVRFFGG